MSAMPCFVLGKQAFSYRGLVVHLMDPANKISRPDSDLHGVRSKPGLTDDQASAGNESSRSRRLGRQ